MHEIDIAYRTMFAELGQRCIDAQFVRDFRIGPDAFPMDGSFVKSRAKDREYWYFQWPMQDGKRIHPRRYVGPVSDAEITSRVEDFDALKDDLKARRKLVSTLVRDAGLPAPERFTGEVVEAMAAAGLFRLRGVLVGTVAFQCYPGLLGVRLPAASMQTGDADFAQFHSISAAVEDSLPPMLGTLRSLDGTFREVPHQASTPLSTQFENRTRYRVEFLTPNRAGDELAGRPAPMPALGGAAAQPLRFLDFLIRDPVRSVLLHRGGTSVLVPAPERYAVHKIIVASRRRADGNGSLKRDKDVRQAAVLIKALCETRRHAELGDAFAEAWDRGPAWREAIGKGLSLLADAERGETQDLLAEAAREAGEDPARFSLPVAADARP